MSQVITIDPITRIEGHARVFLELDDDGQLEAAGLVVNELRGFERILVGMEADRIPTVTARICGVCSSAHHLAACKALERAFGVELPPAAQLARELLYMGHYIHSHALSLFVLQGPDLVFGPKADAATRNVVGVVNAAPEVAQKALRLRSLGQKINEAIGGRGVHPTTSVIGGMTRRVSGEQQRQLAAWTDEALRLGPELGEIALGWLQQRMDEDPALAECWRAPSWSLGTVRGGKLDLYDGLLRVIDAEGAPRHEVSVEAYDTLLAERATRWSYMKGVRIKDGDERPVFRVGPLARVNVADGLTTPRAQAAFEAFRRQHGSPCHSTLMQTHARIIELLYACENAARVVEDPALLDEARVEVRIGAGRGRGHVEAPRGTLFHDYQVDERGIVRRANLLVATQQNYDLINGAIAQAAASHVVDLGDEALLDAIEVAIRCFDPCLSCATHAVGRMPLEVVVRRRGEAIRSIERRS